MVSSLANKKTEIVRMKGVGQIPGLPSWPELRGIRRIYTHALHGMHGQDQTRQLRGEGVPGF